MNKNQENKINSAIKTLQNAKWNRSSKNTRINIAIKKLESALRNDKNWQTTEENNGII